MWQWKRNQKNIQTDCCECRNESWDLINMLKMNEYGSVACAFFAIITSNQQHTMIYSVHIRIPLQYMFASTCFLLWVYGAQLSAQTVNFRAALTRIWIPVLVHPFFFYHDSYMAYFMCSTTWSSHIAHYKWKSFSVADLRFNTVWN